MYVEYSRSPRGFARFAFVDVEGKNCSLEQTDHAAPGAIALMNGSGNRITLGRAEVAALMPLLGGFVATGKL